MGERMNRHIVKKKKRKKERKRSSKRADERMKQRRKKTKKERKKTHCLQTYEPPCAPDLILCPVLLLTCNTDTQAQTEQFFITMTKNIPAPSKTSY